MIYAVIMAGGSGTRLWPSSRRNFPKQAIPFLGGGSLFQRALERLDGLVEPERIFVITTAEQADLLASQAPGIPRRNIVGEPFGRDSAAAAFLAAAITTAEDPEAVNLVMPADHLIAPVERFQRTARRAVSLAEDHGFLVTFGVPPRYGATGYGYIERGEGLEKAEGAYRVKSFKEKPDGATAARYIDEGRYYWNSGMFVWQGSALLEAARNFAPGHHAAISPLGKRFFEGGFEEALAAAYETLPKISIDYAVMEKAPNIATVEADFDWNDVGSHTALREAAGKDGDGNVAIGLVETLGSKNCIAVTGPGHLLALFGCADIVVVHTEDATLVCPSARADELKQLIAVLQSRGELEEYL